MDRPITPTEAAVIRWLLDNAAVGDVAAYRDPPLDELRVGPNRCDCGCSSLYFEPARLGGAVMIADAIALYPDEQMAGLILWAKDQKIAWLEIYDCHPVASHRFPEIANLRPWEEMGERPKSDPPKDRVIEPAEE